MPGLPAGHSLADRWGRKRERAGFILDRLQQ